MKVNQIAVTKQFSRLFQVQANRIGWWMASQWLPSYF